MGLLDSFIIPKEERGKNGKTDFPKTNSKPTTKFPTKEIKFEDNVFPVTDKQINLSSPTPSNGQVSEEHVVKFREMYKNGFDSLNQDGFDFYDFYQSVIHGGIDNPQTYTMAMAMGSAMDKTITKDILLTQADFYMTEISKVHAKQSSSGGSKRQDTINQREQENSSLAHEIQNLKLQAEEIQRKIKTKETELTLVNGKYQPIISDIDSKLMANDLAKNEIITTIEKVKQGINKNLK